METKEQRRFLTTREVGLKLGIHPKVVVRWIRSFDLPCYRIGKEFRFDEKQIDEWIEQFKFKNEFDIKGIVDDFFENEKNTSENRN